MAKFIEESSNFYSSNFMERLALVFSFWGVIGNLSSGFIIFFFYFESM